MADFLLELRCEEIPARMQAGARAELEKLFRKQLDADGIIVDDLTVWSTPRRLALIAQGLPLETEATSVEVKGPRVGAPDQAINGFLGRYLANRDELVERNGVYFLERLAAGRPISRVLQEAVETVVREFSWPKSMRWGAASITTDSLRWVRPLSGIVALLDGDVLECDVPGVQVGRETYGHRFHSSGPIILHQADKAHYLTLLAAEKVIVDHEKRAGIIRDGAAKVAADAGLTLVADEGLVIENAGLTEWPVPLLGRFDDAFLDVPPEVIQLTARVNQKYFVCKSSPSGEGDRDPKGRGGEADAARPSTILSDGPPPRAGEDSLANAFVCTANIDAIDPAVVVDGNRKVLAARLSDARFFWEQDQKTPLAEHAKKLSRITFHEKLGTVADKVERVAKLARWLVEEGIVKPHASPRAGGDLIQPNAPPPEVPAFAGTREELADLAEQAARLCKADLVTEMVGEFPELQGLMGGYYAAKEGLPQEVAEAIRDHYKPVGQGDDVPTAPVTVAVSLADKLDTLVGFFAIDERPTGSKDPFALRRSALAILSLVIQQNLRFRLAKVFANYFDRLEATSLQSFTAMEKFSLFREALQLGLPIIIEGDKIFFEKPIVYFEDGQKHETSYRVSRTVRSEEIAQLKFARMESNQFQAATDELMAFMAERLSVNQKSSGMRYDLIKAIFSLRDDDDLVRLLARVHALQAFVTTEDGTNLLAGYKRAANILKKEGFQSPLPVGEGSGVGAPALDGVNPHPQPLPHGEGANDGIPETGEEDPLAMVDDPDIGDIVAESAQTTSALSYTPEPAEKALIDALDAAAPRAAQAVEGEQFADAMAALATLRAPIDRFFEEVTVNAEEAEKRQARLALLARFRDAVHRVADFSRIEG